MASLVGLLLRANNARHEPFHVVLAILEEEKEEEEAEEEEDEVVEVFGGGERDLGEEEEL